MGRIARGSVSPVAWHGPGGRGMDRVSSPPASVRRHARSTVTPRPIRHGASKAPNPPRRRSGRPVPGSTGTASSRSGPDARCSSHPVNGAARCRAGGERRVGLWLRSQPERSPCAEDRPGPSDPAPRLRDADARGRRGAGGRGTGARPRESVHDGRCLRASHLEDAGAGGGPDGPDPHLSGGRFLPSCRYGAQTKAPGEASGGRFVLRSWSGRSDSNARPPEPHSGALPGCATPRCDLGPRVESRSTLILAVTPNWRRCEPGQPDRELPPRRREAGAEAQ